MSATKILRLHRPHALKSRSKKRDVHFANFVPKGLPLIWTHLTVNLRHLARDYTLPLIATIVFLVVLGGASILRLSQQASLADLLVGVTSIKDGYNTLLSKDQADSVKRNETPGTNRAAGNQAPADSSSSVTVNPNNTDSSTDQPGGGSGNGTGGGGGGQNPAPFEASIASFQQDSVTLVCSGAVPNKGSCSKRYIFNGSVQTHNGPGTVDYSWQTSVTGGTENGSFSVGAGSALTNLQKTVTIACNKPGSHTMSLALTSPSSQQSGNVAMSHNCDDLLL